MLADAQLVEAYLSASLRERLHSGRAVHPPERRDTLGALAFVDISGFSRMADLLADIHGARKAGEVLQTLTNDFMTRLLGTVIDNFGGDVLKFAGDAFLVLWEASDEGALRARREHRHLRRQREQLVVLAQHPQARRVERADPRALERAVDHPVDVALELVRRVLGEGDGEDILGRHALAQQRRPRD